MKISRPHFLIVLCFLTFSFGKCFAEDAPLTRINGLEMVYVFSFLTFDQCGEYTLGERLREAVVAKLEACPFTEEAKLKFYKRVALSSSQEVSEIFKILYAAPPTKFPFNDTRCDSSSRKDNVKFLQEKLSEYDAGKIGLADVLVKRSGESLTCVEATKGGYDDNTNSDNNGVGTIGKGKSPNDK